MEINTLHYKKPTAILALFCKLEFLRKTTISGQRLRVRMNLTMLLIPLGTVAFSILLVVFHNLTLKTGAKIKH